MATYELSNVKLMCAEHGEVEMTGREFYQMRIVFCPLCWNDGAEKCQVYIREPQTAKEIPDQDTAKKILDYQEGKETKD